MYCWSNASFWYFRSDLLTCDRGKSARSSKVSSKSLPVRWIDSILSNKGSVLGGRVVFSWVWSERDDAVCLLFVWGWLWIGREKGRLRKEKKGEGGWEKRHRLTLAMLCSGGPLAQRENALRRKGDAKKGSTRRKRVHAAS